MLKISVAKLFILFIILLFGCDHSSKSSQQKGNMILIGGGKRPEAVMQKFIDLCGGDKAKIVIIPTASEYYKESGSRYMKKFLDLGAEQVVSLNILTKKDANSDSMISALKLSSGIFFGGGNQNRLVDIFKDSKSLRIIHEHYNSGHTLGGTSAGTAIMSEIMITGDGNWEIPIRDSVQTDIGFGLVDFAVLDQHFFQRKRFNRLLNICIQKKIAGIGIDESTAIWIKPDMSIEVLGERVVVVLDPKTAVFPEQLTKILTVRDLKLSVYKKGDILRIH